MSRELLRAATAHADWRVGELEVCRRWWPVELRMSRELGRDQLRMHRSHHRQRCVTGQKQPLAARAVQRLEGGLFERIEEHLELLLVQQRLPAALVENGQPRKVLVIELVLHHILRRLRTEADHMRWPFELARGERRLPALGDYTLRDLYGSGVTRAHVRTRRAHARADCIGACLTRRAYAR